MKISFDSPVILVFSFLCAGIYLLTYSFDVVKDLFILVPEWNASSPAWYFRLFSHSMGHASVEHLIANLSLILLLGPIVEKKFGGKTLLLMMGTTALITSIGHIAFFNTYLLGASGIVFMLIILVSLNNLKNKELPLTFILVVIIFIGGEILGSFNNDQISHYAHIVGGIVGAIFGFLLSRKSGGSSASSSKETIL